MPNLRWIPVLCALAAAGCQAGYTGPTRSTFQDPANDRELEPVNSLPPGFTTNHPLAPETGVVGVTRVAP
jgi:hypothetical protein